MSIKGYNYVVSLIAYLKQNLQGFNARFGKGGRKESGILMDAILKMNLFWGLAGLGHGTECVGRGAGISPHRFLLQGFATNAIGRPTPSPAV